MDAATVPQMRITGANTLELSGQISVPDHKVRDEDVVALLPDDYRPAVQRRAPLASDAERRTPHLELRPDGRLLVRLSSGASAKATFLSLDGVTCRLDSVELP
ncbi:hypothetical protein [Streptomyces sp900129855]|uniref:Uncharacterized protein n=1 Tax=Streptomyces sp. 900129855 TaxID=3155129 RepID=A0ABV2ZLG5_9ACTN